eukprot:scaffold91909_cov75-Phaeocystis_antarctica.AAC.7
MHRCTRVTGRVVYGARVRLRLGHSDHRTTVKGVHRWLWGHSERLCRRCLVGPIAQRRAGPLAHRSKLGGLHADTLRQEYDGGTRDGQSDVSAVARVVINEEYGAGLHAAAGAAGVERVARDEGHHELTDAEAFVICQGAPAGPAARARAHRLPQQAVLFVDLVADHERAALLEVLQQICLAQEQCHTVGSVECAHR